MGGAGNGEGEGAAGGQRAEGAAINHSSPAVAPQMSESEAFAAAAAAVFTLGVSLAHKGVTT